MVISETDNVIFHLAAFGYLGHDLEVMAAAVRDIRIDEADAVTTHVRDSKFHLMRPIHLLIVALGMISGWAGIVINQVSWSQTRNYIACRNQILKSYFYL